ncbi:hypothetical protein RZS08_48800, partial [Arthrospira platensis SPKY1]|nr:hypothetical protein [Arthrospira platensis SPKY1]
QVHAQVAAWGRPLGGGPLHRGHMGGHGRSHHRLPNRVALGGEVQPIRHEQRGVRGASPRQEGCGHVHVDELGVQGAEAGHLGVDGLGQGPAAQRAGVGVTPI